MVDKVREDEIESILKDAELGAKITSTDILSPQAPQVKAPGELGSLVRGAGSGFLMGYQPQVAGALSTGFGMWGDYDKSRDESAALNDAAYKEHPGYYGTGYAGGTAASLIGPGAVAKGGGLAFQGLKARSGIKAAETANQALAAKTMNIMDRAAAAGQEISHPVANALAGERVIAPTMPTNIGRQMLQQGLQTAPYTVPAQGAARGGSTNPPPPATEKTSELNQFQDLRDYLAQFGDNDAKRKAAMEMIASGQGLSDNTA